jgi:hypothetical protein
MGLKPGRPYCMRCRHHHLSAASTNLDPRIENEALKTGDGALPPTRAKIHRAYNFMKRVVKYIAFLKKLNTCKIARYMGTRVLTFSYNFDGERCFSSTPTNL